MVRGGEGVGGARYGPGGTLAEQGRVVEFEEGSGLGRLVGADGRALAFHCTEVTDGTRSIAVGTEVRYRRRAGHQGVWEAVEISPLSSGTTTA